MPPFVSNYLLSRNSYYADFFTVPVATSIAVLWLFSHHEVPPRVFVSAIMAGIIAWTFVEYGVHRWVFHGRSFMGARKEHALHHNHPEDFIGFSPVVTAILGALAFWIFTAIFGAVMGVGLLVGFVAGYMAYFFVHDRVHHSTFKRGSYFALLNSAHEYHHTRFRVNFGVTSPVWDMIFGTYQTNPATPKNEL